MAQAVKNLPAMRETLVQSSCNPGSGRSLKNGMVSPPIFLPGELHGQWSLAGYSPGGRKELGMIERLTLSHFHCNIKSLLLLVFS